MTRDDLTLLVVDDEPDIGDIVVAHAQSLGFSARSISDPMQFGQSFSVETNVIVLDLFMPNIDGVELIRFLGNNRAKCSLVLISGVDMGVLHAAQKLASEYGLDVLGTLSKPFSGQQLKDILSLYDRPMQQRHDAASSEFSVEELSEAISAKRLGVVYQPQCDASTGVLTGVEALVRWTHPTIGNIPPSSFVPVAEQNRLIGALTDFVFETTMQQCALWREIDICPRVAINMSGLVFHDLEMPEKLERQVIKFNLDPSSIVLEVTETALMKDLVKSLDILTRLRMKGFELSIDDFGTGYSSMQQLVRVPFTELKVDQSFVSRMLIDNECFSVVKVCISLAHELGMRVLAEGVEDAQTLAQLVDLGCDDAQGYYLSRPTAANELTSRLQKSCCMFDAG